MTFSYNSVCLLFPKGKATLMRAEQTEVPTATIMQTIPSTMNMEVWATTETEIENIQPIWTFFYNVCVKSVFVNSLSWLNIFSFAKDIMDNWTHDTEDTMISHTGLTMMTHTETITIISLCILRGMHFKSWGVKLRLYVVFFLNIHSFLRRKEGYEDQWKYYPGYDPSFDDDNRCGGEMYGEDFDRRSIHSEQSAHSVHSSHSHHSRQSSFSSRSQQVFGLHTGFLLSFLGS